MSDRESVYKAIDTERVYQNQRWGNTGSSKQPGNGERTIDEFALYISEYADQLRHICGTSDDRIVKMNAVRKVGALCIACMEQHGAVSRV